MKDKPAIFKSILIALLPVHFFCFPIKNARFYCQNATKSTLNVRQCIVRLLTSFRTLCTSEGRWEITMSIATLKLKSKSRFEGYLPVELPPRDVKHKKIITPQNQNEPPIVE